MQVTKPLESLASTGLLEAWSAVNSTSLLPEWTRRLQVGATSCTDIFVRGNARFVKFDSSDEATETPIVVIPSLVNRHYILDLLPEKSLIERFLANRFPVYMMKWENPPDEDRYLSIDDLFERRILKAISIAAAASPTGRVHLVGQCLGGTLASIAAALAPEKIASLSLLTTPIDFENAGQLGAWAKAPGFDVEALVEAYGNVPARFLQTSFQFLKPSGHFLKLQKAFARRKDPDFLVTFFAMEMWSNDAMAFPGQCYRFLIRELYQQNKLAHGELEVCGQRISLANSNFPIFDAVATDDHIVPNETRLKLVATSRLQQVELVGGHIGAVIGGYARKTFWPQWMTWLKNA